MRNTLERLHTIIEEHDDKNPDSNGPKCDWGDEESLSQEAVVFEPPSDIDSVLKEAHSIRKEITLLQLEVERMSAHNERYGTSIRRLTLLKRDADCIAKGIRSRGKALYARIQALGAESARLEEKEGFHAAASRIARVQHDTLTRAFHDAIGTYGQAEETQRKICRDRILRQASIMGTEISEEQLDGMVEKGGEGWDVLSQSLQVPGVRTSRMALCQIRGRHKELVELEARMREIHDLFMQMAVRNYHYSLEWKGGD